MRHALWTALLLGTVAAATASAGGPPPPGIASQWQNPHPPYLIDCFWRPGPYGLAGPTDCIGQPVNGMRPPPFGHRWVPMQPDYGAQQRPAHVWWRSPRDYFMYSYP